MKLAQDNCQICVGLGMVVIESQRPLVMLRRLIEATSPLQSQGQDVVDLRVIRPFLCRGFQMGNSCRPLPAQQEGIAEAPSASGFSPVLSTACRNRVTLSRQ